VAHLRQVMLEELRRRNYAGSTIHAQIHTLEHFSQHFHRRPDFREAWAIAATVQSALDTTRPARVVGLSTIGVKPT